MTRQPRTPRTKRELFDEYLVRDLFLMSQDLGYRRRKKGRRAKSGQWWRRVAPFRAWLGADFANGGDKTVYRMPDGTIRVEPNKGTNA